MSRVILSLCLAACVAGCASPRPAPPDAASAAKSEQEEQEARAKLRIAFSALVEAAVDKKIAELKPQLDLTPEQETAFREACLQESAQVPDALFSMFKLVLTGKPTPPNEPAPSPAKSEREIWEPLLTPKQLAAYDTFKARQRKQQVAKMAAERLNKINLPLALTEDQRNRVSEIFMASAQQRLTAMDDFAPFPDTYWENKELAVVLTPAQFKKYEKLSGQRNSSTQKNYAGGFFFPPVFSFPSSPGSFGGSFRGR